MFKFSSRSARVSTAAAAAERNRSRRSVASPQQPDWISIRRKDRPQDLELAPHASAWWHALPTEVRPVHLVQKYPRIVNLLSACWNDPRQQQATFESLLHDQRGARQGFPTMIVSELRRLRAYAHEQAADQPRSTLLVPALWQAGPDGRPAADRAAGASPAPQLADVWAMTWETMNDA